VVTIDELWIDTLQRIYSRAAHELKGALNGVSVNLEVVRSRAEKPDAPASAVRHYADSAGEQLGLVIVMTEALLALSRPAREPVELPPLVRRFEAILAPSARAEGRSFTVVGPIDSMGTTPAVPNGVRVAIGATLLRAIQESTRVTCRADDSPGARLHFEPGDGAPLTPDPAVAAAVAEVGIHIELAAGGGITVDFPAAHDGRTPGRS
jgi:signal transduction histidine kinase